MFASEHWPLECDWKDEHCTGMIHKQRGHGPEIVLDTSQREPFWLFVPSPTLFWGGMLLSNIVIQAYFGSQPFDEELKQANHVASIYEKRQKIEA